MRQRTHRAFSRHGVFLRQGRVRPSSTVLFCRPYPTTLNAEAVGDSPGWPPNRPRTPLRCDLPPAEVGDKAVHPATRQESRHPSSTGVMLLAIAPRPTTPTASPPLFLLRVRRGFQRRVQNLVGLSNCVGSTQVEVDYKTYWCGCKPCYS